MVSIYDLLKKISKKRLVIIATNTLDKVEDYANRVILIKDGSIIKDSKNGKIVPTIEVNQVKPAKLPFNYIFKKSLNKILINKISFILTVIVMILSIFIINFSKNIINLNLDSEYIKVLNKNNIKEIIIDNKKEEDFIKEYTINQNNKIPTIYFPQNRSEEHTSELQ